MSYKSSKSPFPNPVQVAEFQGVATVVLVVFCHFLPLSVRGLGTFDFCETLPPETRYSLSDCGLLFLTQPLDCIIFAHNISGFHKSRQELIMNQQVLFHGEHRAPRLRYQTLFEYLPKLPHSYCFGRPRTEPNAMLRAFIYRGLRRLSTLSDLAYSLAENPSLAEAVGFDPFGPLPSIERFSAWLRSTPNECLQKIRFSLISQLIQQSIVPGNTVLLDSAPIPATVKENNIKTYCTDRFNKNRYPKTDPEARLGAYRVFPGSGPQNVRYFWGYRNHVAVDFDTELPLWEQTCPANYHESRVAIPLLDACAQKLSLPIEIVCADASYDSEKILAFIIENLHAQPIIASNSRYQPNPNFRIQGKVVLCPADLPMVYKGHMTPKKTGITYKQYCCPLHYRKKMRQQFLLCPANHPKFLSQKGCNYLLRETPSYRSQIPYGSPKFETHYNKRTTVERVFSRLLSIAMQKPTVRGLQATQNYCTIAHITVLLVASAAYHQGHPDKLAFVRSFVPNFMVET